MHSPKENFQLRRRLVPVAALPARLQGLPASCWALAEPSLNFVFEERLKFGKLNLINCLGPTVIATR